MNLTTRMSQLCMPVAFTYKKTGGIPGLECDLFAKGSGNALKNQGGDVSSRPWQAGRKQLDDIVEWLPLAQCIDVADRYWRTSTPTSCIASTVTGSARLDACLR